VVWHLPKPLNTLNPNPKFPFSANVQHYVCSGLFEYTQPSLMTWWDKQSRISALMYVHSLTCRWRVCTWDILRVYWESTISEWHWRGLKAGLVRVCIFQLRNSVDCFKSRPAWFLISSQGARLLVEISNRVSQIAFIFEAQVLKLWYLLKGVRPCKFLRAICRVCYQIGHKAILLSPKF